MKRIPLTQGKFALVDDADFEAVNQFKWRANKQGRGWYAWTGSRPGVSLHHFILKVFRVDHRDGDGLNNQRNNLRPADEHQNRMAFRRKRVGMSSKFRGVSWHRRKKKWQAGIRLNKKPYYLGIFSCEVDAAKAYDIAARKYFGEFASPNFPI